MGDRQTSNEKQILLRNFDKKWVATIPDFCSKLLRENLLYHLKGKFSQAFSLDVHMSSILIFAKTN